MVWEGTTVRVSLSGPWTLPGASFQLPAGEEELLQRGFFHPQQVCRVFLLPCWCRLLAARCHLRHHATTKLWVIRWTSECLFVHLFLAYDSTCVTVKVLVIFENFGRVEFRIHRVSGTYMSTYHCCLHPNLKWSLQYNWHCCHWTIFSSPPCLLLVACVWRHWFAMSNSQKNMAELTELTDKLKGTQFQWVNL